MTHSPPDLASLLSELLLPRDPSHAAAEPDAEAALWYTVGPGARDLMRVPLEEEGKWQTVGGGRPHECSLLYKLAGRFWTVAEKNLPRGFELLLAVADRVSNAITLSWRVRQNASPSVGTKGADAALPRVEGLIGDLVEAYLDCARHDESWLIRRPSLHLVLAGDGPIARQLEAQVTRRLSQLGLYLTDFQVRWLSESRFPPQSLEPFLRELLLHHQPWDFRSGWPGLRATLTREEIASLGAQLAEFLAAAESLAGQLERVDSGNPFRVHAELRSLAAKRPRIALNNAAEPAAQPELASALARLPQTVTLGVELAARKWLAEPLSLPLAAMTLVAGDNAMGKTTLAEALCLAHTGLPRPRLTLPWGSERWGDRHSDAVKNGAGPPRLALLRMRFDSANGNDPEGTDNPVSEALPARDVLPLFADDADLSAGEPGELAVVTWLPFPGVRPAALAERAAGADLAERFLAAWALLEKAHSVKQDEAASSMPAPGAKAELEPRESGSDLMVAVAAWIVRALQALLAEELEERTAAERAAKEAGSTETPENISKLECDTLNVERDIQRTGRRRKKLPRGVLVRYQRQLADKINDPEHWGGGEQGWKDLEAVDALLGGGSAFAALARSAFLRDLERLRKEFAEFSNRLAERLFDGCAFEKQLERYLSGSFDPVREQAVRRSTASQVRHGQALRLARWLSCGGIDWPFLVVDEPTLGQDDASCARSLARYLRLLRKVESLRWWRHTLEARDINGPAAASGGLDCVEITDLEKWRGDRFGGRSGHLMRRPPFPSGPIPRLPVPPQILVLSYREAALSVVSDLEGAVLDDEMRERLGNLMPPAWTLELAASMRRAWEEYRVAWNSLVGYPGERMAPTLLRRYWQPPIAETAARSGDLEEWVSKAIQELERLGLLGLARDLGEEARQEPRVLIAATWRLLAWLLATDLLPVALADGEHCFELSSVSYRLLSSFDGRAPEQGPTRLRRVVPLMDRLPALPPAWKEQLERALKTVGQEEAALPVLKVAVKGPSPADERDEILERVRSEIRWAGFLVAGAGEKADQYVIWARETPEFGQPKYRWTLGGQVTPPHRSEAMPLEAALESLLGRLVSDRAENLARDTDEGDAVNLVLASYNPEEAPATRLGFRLVAEPLASRANPLRDKVAMWERIFGAGLERIRSALAASPNTRTVCLYPRCTPATAVRAGAIFHRASGFGANKTRRSGTWSERPRRGRRWILRSRR